jgi:hypothetical protein
MRLAIATALVLVAAVVGIAQAAPAWTQSGTHSFSGTSDGTTVVAMTGSSYTTSTVALLGANTLYTYTVASYTTDGMDQYDAYGWQWGITVAGTSSTFYPLTMFIQAGDGVSGDGRKEVTLGVSISVATINSVTGAATLKLSGKACIGDTQTPDHCFMGQVQTISVSTTAVTGTFTFTPGMIFEAGNQITTHKAEMTLV